tara:strand:+ start:70436 stop:70657 length:222 start_codon:yes stop_codon:yes gene_type:complete
MSLEKKGCSSNIKENNKCVHQGDCIHLKNDKDLFQVIGIDNNHKKCWVRRWPLLTEGSPVFEISTNQIVVPSI